jgi:hypothetical protein
MSSQTKVFTKLIDSNKNVDYAISTVINEYDIKSAHASALYFIKGEDTYNELMKLDKLSRNTLIGKMIRDDPKLSDKISGKLLSWFNQFCEINNIKEQNFISSTRDSLLLVNKKPSKCALDNGVCLFRNKDGEFTSYIRINNLEVLYDGFSGNLRIKGINKDYVDGNPVFIRLFKQLLSLIESSKNLSTQQILKKANMLRNKYIYSKDPLMWASVFDGNKYVYSINGEKVLSESLLQDDQYATLIKYDNYLNLFMPVFRICFKPH